jgi:hypothetical protein
MSFSPTLRAQGNPKLDTAIGCAGTFSSPQYKFHIRMKNYVRAVSFSTREKDREATLHTIQTLLLQQNDPAAADRTLPLELTGQALRR